MSPFFGPTLDPLYQRTPLTLIDVGARGGLQPNWQAAQQHLRLVGFEPDEIEHARLAANADGHSLYINAAVAGHAGSAVLNVGRDGGTSSLLEPNFDFLRRFPRAERFETVQRVTVPTDMLDTLLPAHGVGDPDFLKLDTQGAELAILQGAPRTLEALFGVELEIQLAPLYQGQPSFGALDDLLRNRGFQLMDLRPSYWKRAAGAAFGGPKGQLVFADGLYFRTESSWQAHLDALPLDAQAAKLARALTICLLYGYRDYAIELFYPHAGVFEPAQRRTVGRVLRSGVPLSARIPHFRGRGFLSHLFFRLHRALFPTVDRWASGGRHLGNLD